MMEGETRSSPGPHLRTFVIRALRVLCCGLREGRLELRHVLVLEEQAERRVDCRVPGVARDDAVRQGTRELVGLPLLERPLQIGAVEPGVRVLPGRDRALDRVEGVLRLLAAQEREPL